MPTEPTVNRFVRAVGLCVALVGCSDSTLPTSPQSTAPPTETHTPASAPAATEIVGAKGVVAYRKCEHDGPDVWTSDCRIWVEDADGTNARQLVPFDLDPEKPRHMDMPDVQYPLAWSGDGAWLYFRFERVEVPDDGIETPHSGLAVTDASGSRPVELLDVSSPNRRQPSPWCPAIVEFDNCQANLEGMVISPDGWRLAYTIQEGRELNVSSIVVLDVVSGSVARLESTRTRNPGSLPNEGPNEPCTPGHGGYNEAPQWSPDGTRLVFTRFDCDNAIFTVNADGSDLRRLVRDEVPALAPHWSPDGSTIAFHVATADGTTVDVYTVRPDGSDLRALTSDGASVWPHWTRDGRIVLVRWTDPVAGEGDLWVMDGDGGNAMQIDGTVPALTAAGCTVCPFPVGSNRYWTEDGLSQRLWQPVPDGGQ
jgi:Tol biopolymer transport system component